MPMACVATSPRALSLTAQRRHPVAGERAQRRWPRL